jgi:signal peptidase I
MSIYLWFVFYIGTLLNFDAYETAGRKRWEAAHSIYNAIVLMKIIGRYLVDLVTLFQL